MLKKFANQILLYFFSIVNIKSIHEKITSRQRALEEAVEIVLTNEELLNVDTPCVRLGGRINYSFDPDGKLMLIDLEIPEFELFVLLEPVQCLPEHERIVLGYGWEDHEKWKKYWTDSKLTLKNISSNYKIIQISWSEPISSDYIASKILKEII